jgi:hypothetical protein
MEAVDITGFWVGVLSSLTATAIIYAVFKWAWPTVKDRCLYSGVCVAGSWDVTEERNGGVTKSGTIDLKQTGRIVTGTSIRTRTRGGQESQRKFDYHGTISGHQLTLIFEDSQGKGFDTGTYVFIVQNDGKTMVGNTTFHGKPENKIVSEARTLKKVVS